MDFSKNLDRHPNNGRGRSSENLGEEVEETVTPIRKIGLMVDLSGVERARQGGKTISESAREREMGGRRKRCHLLFGR